ncbi:ABC transporter substrate-binding protein [Nostoc sp. FACHB-110]|uniref:ABC transporter substrate-binding protein n=1 Tax=Nostoc sp. FACHB-110 TaxID=2692834 RepID=UPI001684961E|nr:ABC transporter substrate-binding protein [Nostoc sp. FACHB-110]MBD2438987.1 ABC transporter substrate-binding protein [Nostoc sp. FACHB-110]
MTHYIRNPYTVGTPIDNPERFFGRDSLLGFIKDNLRQNVKFILLHGHRRIGKSSVLKQIPKDYIEQSEFIFVPFDLQQYSKSKLSEIIHRLVEEIIHHLEINDELIIPSQRDLENDLDEFAQNYLTQIYENLGDKKLVLLLDEFDVIYDGSDNILEKGSSFFRYLEKLLKQQDKLLVIAVAGRSPGDLVNLFRLFGTPPFKNIGVLDEISAERLICKPAQGTLKYDAQAIETILNLTANHPYLIQVICFTIFNVFILTKNNSHWQVTSQDVIEVIEQAINQAEGGLNWFWTGLTSGEQLIISAIAEGQNQALLSDEQNLQEPLKLLESYGITLTEELAEATNNLAKKGLLDDTKRQIKIKLVCRWLAKSHPLRQQIEIFREEKVNTFIDEASQLYQQSKIQDALNTYNLALELNPHHSATLVKLAGIHLELKSFDEALKLYERAYKVDSIGNKEPLLAALKMYGHNLILQQEYALAKEQYKRVLEIEPRESSAQEKLELIGSFESRSNYQPQPNAKNASPNQRRDFPIKTIGLATGIITLVSLVIINIPKSPSTCPTGKQKVNGNCEVVDPPVPNLTSSGQRTLFPTLTNSDRDKGIEAFKQGNYEQAVDYFGQAVRKNRNDPEVLIYYNNALARKQRNQFTFAVAVPINNLHDIAQELLRGVALAQNQFNAKGGLNRRLLEIVIANDYDEPAQAKEVAQQLVDNKSILAVIGHNTSTVTYAALDEYLKANPPLAIISPTSASSKLKGKIFFRIAPSNVQFAKQLANHIWNKLKLQKVVIFYNPSDFYSDDLREYFTKNFEDLGGKVVGNPIDLAQSNFNSEQKLNEVVSQYQPQAALLIPAPKDTPIALDILQAKANSNNLEIQKIKFFSGASLYGNETLKKGGEAVEGLVVTSPWFKDSSLSKDFAKIAQQQWGGDVNYRTATSYDATQAVIKALSPNSSRATVLQKLREVHLSPQETSGNEIEFTDGEIQTQPILIEVKDGKFQLITREDK